MRHGDRAWPLRPLLRGAAVDSSAAVDVGGVGGSSCPGNPPFSPGVTAGSTETRAGQDADFLLTLVRHDREQLVRRFSVTLPPGVAASLGSIVACSRAAAASASCPDESRIGSAVAEIGSGPSPALVHGDVFLTDAYRGAPFGLSVVFHTSLGPFDLGNLQVRGTISLDRRTGQVEISTDSLPSVVEGVPIRFRTIGMDLDRPGLLRNPTSCRTKQIVSTVDAVDGRAVSTTSPFGVGGCNRLTFRPRFSSALIDSPGLRKNGHPGLRFAVRMGEGGANLSRFRLKLPRPLAFHGAAVKAICARGDAAEGVCPRDSRVGTGIVRTPMLNQPLRGPVYLVQPEGDGLPGFWTSLTASGVHLDVGGRTLLRKGHLLMEMASLPDMPLSSFAMRIGGGKAGLLSLRKGLCTAGRPRRLVSPVAAEAQDDAYRLGRVRLRTSKRCGVARKGTRAERVRRAALLGETR